MEPQENIVWSLKSGGNYVSTFFRVSGNEVNARESRYDAYLRREDVREVMREREISDKFVYITDEKFVLC